MTSSKKLGTVGLVARFKPLHKGAALMLETVCSLADHVKIGIGSSNKYNLRNPFFPQESEAMIDNFLREKFHNYEFLQIPDFGNGKKWREYVVNQYGSLDYFITANPYVKDLLENDYTVVHPASLIPKEKWFMLRGTEVRLHMAHGKDWQSLVPDAVAAYLLDEKNGNISEGYANLVERFCNKFGKEVLSVVNIESDYKRTETREEEEKHSKEK